MRRGKIIFVAFSLKKGKRGIRASVEEYGYPSDSYIPKGIKARSKEDKKILRKLKKYADSFMRKEMGYKKIKFIGARIKKEGKRKIAVYFYKR